MTLIYTRKVFVSNVLFLSRPRLSPSSLTNSAETYAKYRTVLPFTEKEKIVINNAIILLLKNPEWTASLTHRGIPPFFVRNNEFRTNLIEYLDKSNDARAFLRGNLGDLVRGSASRHLDGESVPAEFIKYIQSFVADNMPNLALACHSVQHLTDFRAFGTEYQTSTERRNVFLHVGPPNSGKTHEAIARLSEAVTGIYCSPLRLLAWEMYSRLNAAKVPCALLTGQENIDNNEAHVSCTVETVPFERSYEVAVLDEMQMAGDLTRGYAWTRAFLGLKVGAHQSQAPEIHVCGSNSCLALARKLADIRGDVLEVTEHTRLGALRVLEAPVPIEALEPGDCVVCFSRNEAFALRAQIESTQYAWDPRRANQGRPGAPDLPITSLVYGSLPPATRTHQVERFNAGETKILIASDAIGMGVNVAIRRVVFHRLTKFDGSTSRGLTAAEVQQIAGRAGRFGLGCGEGQVSCSGARDLPLLRALMAEEPPQIEQAVIAPSPEVIEAFSSALNAATGSRHAISDVTNLISSMTRTGRSFVMCDFAQVNAAGKCLEGIPLPFEALRHYLFVPIGSPLTTLAVRAFAASHALLNSVKVANILNERSLDPEPGDVSAASAGAEVKRLELLHEVGRRHAQTLDVYTWLSNKFPAVFVDREEVSALKARVAEALSRLLSSSVAPDADELSDAQAARDLIRPEFLISA